MKIIEKKTSELIPYGNNPRINDEAVGAVAESIKQFGFKVPIVIDKTNIIIAGHTRQKAAESLGIDKVPCIIADDLTDEQIKAFRLADNKTAELASWNIELLEAELAEISDIDMSQFGFEDDIFQEEGEVVEDDFDEEPPEQPTSQLGQIYKLGRHRLMVGDSTKPEDVKTLMDGEQADLVVTDPPYNVDYENKDEYLMKYRGSKRTEAGVLTGIKNDSMSGGAFQEFLTKAFDNLRDNLKGGGVFYIWHAAMEGYNFMTACHNSGLQVRQQLIWVKNCFVLGRQDYQWKHEPCLYGWKDGGGHYFINDRTQDTIVKDDTVDFDKLKKDEAVELLKELYNKNEPFSAIYENRPMKSELHPTMKPVNLFARLIKNSSMQGEKVLDLFGGSGTTLMACEQLDRNAYIMEFDPKYADVIINRWEEFTGKKAELLKK